MSQMKKTVAMNTPARRRLRGRFSDIAPPDAGDVDAPAPADEPRPKTSSSKKSGAARPPAKPATTKKTNTTRAKKRKGVAKSKPEPEPPQETTPTAPQPHASGSGTNADPTPAVDPPTTGAKKVTRQPRQGTRASARLRGQGPQITHEPTPIEPRVERTKRKRGRKNEVPNEEPAVEAPKKRSRSADDQTVAPVQGKNTAAVPVQIEDTAVVPVQTEDTPAVPAQVKDTVIVPAQVEDTAAAPPQAKDAAVSDGQPIDPSTGEDVTLEQTDAPGQTEKTTTGDSPPVEPGPSRKATVEDDEESADEEVDTYTIPESMRPPDDGLIRRFYMTDDGYGGVTMRLGLFTPEQYQRGLALGILS